MIEHLQNARIEHRRHPLETTGLPVEDISVEAGSRFCPGRANDVRMHRRWNHLYTPSFWDPTAD
jgi:hypothetical protein